MVVPGAPERVAPAAYDGRTHSTIFRARPDELLRGLVLLPAEKLQRQLKQQVERAKRGVKRIARVVGR